MTRRRRLQETSGRRAEDGSEPARLYTVRKGRLGCPAAGAGEARREATWWWERGVGDGPAGARHLAAAAQGRVVSQQQPRGEADSNFFTVLILKAMFCPDQYPGLDDYYEQKHRTVLAERGEVPPLLRLRGHNPNETLVYDPRYKPYFRRMDLLQFVLSFKGTPPWLNATALTALTDRWRPETHSFHLPLLEMSITLEDIAMISGLPIESRALTWKVNWRPYTVLRQYPLSNMCLRDQHLWRVWCPMICFYAVEWHLPHRVSKQFRVQQCTPPDYVETSVKLHKTNRQSNKTVINWEEHHITWVDMWNAQRQHRVENDETPDTDEAAYLRHLEWMRIEYIVIHKAVWTRSDCLDLLPSEAGDAAFNNSIRETVGAHLDYGPLHDRVGTELWRCINDSNVVLARAPCPQMDGLVRTTLQKVANRCRTLAALLSCHGVSSTDVRARAQYTMDVQSSARLAASWPRASSARSSSSGAHVSSSRAHEEEIEEEDESDNKAADQDFIEFGASQMEDAPQSSQPTQPTEATRRASSRNIRRPGWQNTPEGYVTNGKMAAKRGGK
ncbi:hypothetical protein D1007_21033 [Hordeum vulgare]|nr:hypothetical protein D1007_21033 [Hordeum vulgare]